MTSNYFKDKQPTRVFGNEKHDQTQEKFTDKYFPPTLQTLLGKKPDGTYYKSISEIPDKEDMSSFKNIVFKRVSEFMESPLLFEGMIDLNDVEQGRLGDCYFLASIASLCKYPRMIYELFQTKTLSKNGFYELTLFVNGEWQTVVIDDYIPCDASLNESAFVRPRNGEVWLLLLEKAWAKVNGSYLGIIGGVARQAFLTLTGFPSKRIALDEKNIDPYFKELQYAISKGAIIGTGSTAAISKEQGIYGAHAYSVTDAFVITNKSGQQKRVVHLRNPHGKKEWTGTWSKTGFVPDDPSVAKVDLRKKGLGNFYMPFTEFVKYYKYAYICYFQLGAKVKNFNVNREYSNEPIVFNVRMEQAGRLTVHNICKQAIFNREKNPSRPAIIFSRVDSNNKVVSFIAKQYNNNDNFLSEKLEKGTYIVWICANYPKLSAEDIGTAIRFSSSKNYFVEYVGKDSDLKCLRSLVMPAVKKNLPSTFKETHVFNLFEGSFIGVWYAKAPSDLELRFEADKPQGYRICKTDVDKDGKLVVKPNEESIAVGLVDDSARSLYFGAISGSYYKVKSTNPHPKVHSSRHLSSNWFNKNLAYSTPSFFDVVIRSEKEMYFKNRFPSNDPTEMFFLKLSKVDPVMSNLLSEYRPFAVKGNKFAIQSNYKGQLNGELKPEGIGAYLFDSKTFKFGQWKGGDMNGQGKYYRKGMLYYQGGFANDIFHGKGMLYSNGRLSIQGTFVNGKAEGRGTYFFSDGSVWEGMFVQGGPKGSGRFTDKNGNVSEATIG